MNPIQWLKENKTECIIYKAMPDVVKEWCDKRKDKGIFYSLGIDGDWGVLSPIGCFKGGIYALPDDYTEEPEIISLEPTDLGYLEYYEKLDGVACRHVVEVERACHIKQIKGKKVKWLGWKTKQFKERLDRYGYWYDGSDESPYIQHFLDNNAKPVEYISADYKVIE